MLASSDFSSSVGFSESSCLNEFSRSILSNHEYLSLKPRKKFFSFLFLMCH